MEKTLREIAEIVGGKLVSGSSDLVIKGVNGLEEATEEQISFAVPPYLEFADQSRACALIIPEDAEFTAKPVIKVANPRAAFAMLLTLFREVAEIPHGVSPFAFVDPTAKLGTNVDVLPFAYIAAGAEIGDNTVIYSHVYIGNKAKLGKSCVIYPSVVIREGCVLGDRVVIQQGAAIGGDGFGFTTADGKHTKVPQMGNVVIGDDVEIGCNTCIDRATAESTIIGKGTKIDNLVHVGHNCVLGENCLIVACVGLSGSTIIGNNVTMAGQSATKGHLKIGDNCVFAGRSGIITDIPANSICSGFPARPHKEWLRNTAVLEKATDLAKRIKQLEKQVTAFSKEKGSGK